MKNFTQVQTVMIIFVVVVSYMLFQQVHRQNAVLSDEKLKMGAKRLISGIDIDWGNTSPSSIYHRKVEGVDVTGNQQMAEDYETIMKKVSNPFNAFRWGLDATKAGVVGADKAWTQTFDPYNGIRRDGTEQEQLLRRAAQDPWGGNLMMGAASGAITSYADNIGKTLNLWD